MARLIDANNLMEYCLNQKNRTVDCNDIARFPSVLILPDNATNGDVLKAIYPTCEIRQPREDLIEVTLDGVIGVTVSYDWWNAPYKEQKNG